MTTLSFTGPWFQFYFLLSLLTTALGAFFALKTDLGLRRAAGAGVALSFLNFYVVRKFPLHLPHACVHWTILGILLDYLIARRYWLRQAVSMRLICARLTVLVLCLGLDLGYVAGFSLASFCLTVLWILISGCLRCHCKVGALRAALIDGLRPALQQARSLRPQLASMTVIGLLAAWLYLPLSYQLTTATTRYDFSGLRAYSQWEDASRLFVPFLPKHNPETLNRHFKDRGESWGFHFSPGISFVALGLLGIASGYRRLGVVAPFVALFMMCLFFLPEIFPTLKVFPWFRFARAPGRATCVFPVFLLIFYLNTPKCDWKKRGIQISTFILGCLLLTESLVAYRLIIDARSKNPGFSPDGSFQQTMDIIRSTPGEALFEWPFSIAPRGGALSVYHGQLGGAFQLAQFHHKKGIGTYFGRLHPDNILLMVEAGWPHLIFADAVGRRQHRDFVEEEWDGCGSFRTCDSLLNPEWFLSAT